MSDSARELAAAAGAMLRSMGYQEGTIRNYRASWNKVIAFCDAFHAKHPNVPIVAVPSSYNTITEAELAAHGVRIVIYANQLTRSAFPAMENAARSILVHHRAHEIDAELLPIKDIIRLIEVV